MNAMALVRFDAPSDIFDVEGAYVMRCRRVPAAMIDELNEIRRQTDAKPRLYEAMSRFFPEWHGIIDPFTGEPLPNPTDDPMVFDRLDVIEQLPWLAEMLRASPKAGKSTSDRT